MAFNKTQLKNLVDTNLPDNSSGLITPENNRALVKEIIDTAFSTVPSISALKNYDTTSLNDGDKLEVAGYYEKNDGGGGLFVWDADSTEADNGGTIIQATGVTTGRWKRLGGSGVNLPEIAAISVSNPPAGYKTLFFDASNASALTSKDSSGTLVTY